MTRGLTYCLILLLAVVACSGDQPALLTPDKAIDGPPATGFSIGPVAGLTTVWHAAPARVAVPIGTDVMLACSATPGMTVTWAGAIALRRDDTHAYAVCRMSSTGEHSVRVETGERNDHEGGKGGRPDETAAPECVITAVDIKAQDIVVRAKVTASPVVLDENASNLETMNLYFAGGKRFQSLSALREIAPGRYRTAVNRIVRIHADAEPDVFNSMIEWRSPGATPVLDVDRDYLLATPEPLQVSLGSTQNPRRIRVDTYRVEIVSRTPDGPVMPGVPVTLRARTVPPGFERDITWLSSTKYGTACPVLGHGPAFTAVFEDSWGPHPDMPNKRYEWLGVRADNATFDYDLKASAGGLCQLAILEFVGRPAVLPPNGRLYFPHIPCSTYSPPFFTAPVPGAPPLEPAAITGATVCYYDITAPNLNAACDSIFKVHGPMDPTDGRRHAGSTEMSFTANWAITASNENSQTIHVESVTYSVKVWLPRWTNVPAGDVVAWNNLIKELEKHEQGHVTRYNNSMPTVSTQVSCTSFSVAPTAPDSIIGTEANLRVNQNPAYQTGEQDQAKYDAPQSPSNPTGTNHGTQNGQNASWPSGQLFSVGAVEVRKEGLVRR